MRKIPLSYGLIYYLDNLEGSEAALAADPDAESLAAPFQDTIKEWEGIFKSERQARHDVVRAEAVVRVRNEQLDILTMSFASMVRAVAAYLLSKLFSIAPGKFIRRGLRQQCEQTQNVILREVDKLDPDHALKPFAPKLKTASESAVTALDERAKAKGARRTVANDIEEWKEGVNALRTTSYAELLKIATEKKYPKSWVEAFFPSDGASEEDEPAAPPTVE
jgi:hypothetical protein